MKPMLIQGIALGMLASAANVRATDLGTLGPTYEIREPHLLNFIEQRLRDKERSGELQRLTKEAQARGVDAVTRPQPVPNLRPTETARTFYFDPTFTLDRNIVDAQGRLLFAAGTRKNPLEVVSLSKRLLFFDARDRRQVTRASDLMARYSGKVKPILTGGSYLDLMKAWRVPVYYDQQGTLTQRFGIRQVPALVSQEGSRLRIDEVLLP
jgi:conjugal transfer pilus assembly protein TraW